jgi:hypothetical protein
MTDEQRNALEEIKAAALRARELHLTDSEIVAAIHCAALDGTQPDQLEASDTQSFVS